MGWVGLSVSGGDVDLRDPEDLRHPADCCPNGFVELDKV
jgi:hypothetical protein